MFNQNNFGGPRQMVQGNWKCTDCGKEITELPFEPSEGKPVYCRDCWAKNRPPRTNNGFQGPRQMVQGNWKCTDCGKEITELPFEPSEGKPVYCRDCWAKNRPP